MTQRMPLRMPLREAAGSPNAWGYMDLLDNQNLNLNQNPTAPNQNQNPLWSRLPFPSKISSPNPSKPTREELGLGGEIR